MRHLYFQYTGLNSDQWQEINQPIQDLKVARLQNKAPIPPAPYIDITRKLLRSYNPHELAVGLIAATGRRKTEILARGEFTLPEQPVDYLHQDYQLIFSGQLKKREPEPPFAIGTLFPAKTVLLAWQRYRRTRECKQLLKRIEKLETENKSEQQITKIISDQRSHSIDRVVKKYYTTFLPPRHGAETDSAHTLRAASVHLITARECSKKIEPLLFASWQLGHFINDESVDNSKLTRIITSCGYLNYYVESDVPYPKDLGDKSLEIQELKLVNEQLSQKISSTNQEIEQWRLRNQELEEKVVLSPEIDELKALNQELDEKVSSSLQSSENTVSTEEMEELRTLNQELEQKVASYQIATTNQELTNLIDSRIRLIIAQEIKSQLSNLVPSSVEAIDNTFSPPVSESSRGDKRVKRFN